MPRRADAVRTKLLCNSSAASSDGSARLGGARQLSGRSRNILRGLSADREHGARPEPGRCRRSCRHFDGRKRARRRRNPPRSEILGDSSHATGSIDEHDVNRKPHEARVNRRTRRQHQCSAFRPRLTTEKALAARGTVERRLDVARDDRAGDGVDQATGAGAAAQQRLEKVRHRVQEATRAAAGISGNSGTEADRGPGVSTLACGGLPRNSRKSTVHPCVDSRLRNRL